MQKAEPVHLVHGALVIRSKPGPGQCNLEKISLDRGVLQVWGWMIDPSVPGIPQVAYIYISGKGPSAVYYLRVHASVERPDVVAYFHDNRAYAESGFYVTHTLHIPAGAYDVQLIYKSRQALYVCQVAKSIKVSRGDAK